MHGRMTCTLTFFVSKMHDLTITPPFPGDQKEDSLQRKTDSNNPAWNPDQSCCEYTGNSSAEKDDVVLFDWVILRLTLKNVDISVLLDLSDSTGFDLAGCFGRHGNSSYMIPQRFQRTPAGYPKPGTDLIKRMTDWKR